MAGFMGIIALVLPVLIALVNKKIADSIIRFLISFLVCSIVGTVMNFIAQNGSYTGMSLQDIADSISNSILVLTALTNISYQLVWDNPAVGKLLNPEKGFQTQDTPLQQLNLK